MILSMNVAECYCNLPEFYEKVARKLPEYSADAKFDCTKIEVSETICDTLEDFFITEKDGDRVAFGMMWLNYGPKVSDTLKKFDVKIYDGFLNK